MWIVRIGLLVLLFSMVGVFGVFLRRRADGGFGRALENRPLNLLGVAAYNLACFLLTGLPSDPKVFTPPAFLAAPVVIWGFALGGLALLASSAWLMIASVRIRKTVGGESVKAGLLTGGVYAFARHPIYLGISGFAAGVALLSRSWDGLLMVPFVLALNLLEAGIEERFDIGPRFPGEYREYRKHTRAFGPLKLWVFAGLFLAAIVTVSVFSAAGMTAWIGFLRFGIGLFAIGLLIFLLASVVRGMRRPAGSSAGERVLWLRSPLFYLAASAVFFGLCVLLWIPLPRFPGAEAVALIGALLCLAGLVFVLWGRLALADMYFVSTGFGVQLFAGHRLVRRGPYAVVRHPMYSGLILASLGALALYQTWTAVLFAVCGLAVLRRARREEEALAGEFGPEWEAYRRAVPMFFPRLSPRPAGRNRGDVRA